MPGFKAITVSGLYRVREGGEGLQARLVEICRHVSEAIEDGARLIVLSDRDSTADLAPIPSLLLTACVHHHLIREKTRTMVGLVAEAGDAREVHHMALLLGYGASAVNPYLAFESIEDMIATGAIADIDPYKAARNYVKAMGKGVLKVMSKMGISTVASYMGAQVFEAVGLVQRTRRAVLHRDRRQLGGIGLEEIHAEVAARHSRPGRRMPRPQRTPSAGDGRRVPVATRGRTASVQPRDGVPAAALDPHPAVRGVQQVHRRGGRLVPQGGDPARPVRALKVGARDRRCRSTRSSPSTSIVTRFSTGAMSYGSISAEAHETLAIAMNRIGARSNTGEGGEDADRCPTRRRLRRSAVKQVASGRFGVTSEYLVNADDLQIKMAQGAKPGEGGQLPAHKVYPWIARTRHSTPGVGLISPPPHHDIYSIEDLAQLIHDLKNANDRPGSTSSWSPRSAWARSRRGSARRTPMWSSSPATTAAPARRR